MFEIPEALKGIGTLFGRSGDLDKFKKQLERLLVADQEIISLGTHKGWQSLQSAIMQEVAGFDAQIIALTARPVDNEKALVFLTASRAALLTVVGVFAQAEERLAERSRQLREANNRIKITEDTLTSLGLVKQ